MTMDLKEEKVTDLSNWTFNEISIFDWSLVAKLEAGKKEGGRAPSLDGEMRTLTSARPEMRRMRDEFFGGSNEGSTYVKKTTPSTLLAFCSLATAAALLMLGVDGTSPVPLRSRLLR